MPVAFRVEGYVQGVGFRAFVVRLAGEMGCLGEVWNTRDGAVELVASGAQVERLPEALQRGPGRVDRVIELGEVGPQYGDRMATRYPFGGNPGSV